MKIRASFTESKSSPPYEGGVAAGPGGLSPKSQIPNPKSKWPLALANGGGSPLILSAKAYKPRLSIDIPIVPAVINDYALPDSSERGTAPKSPVFDIFRTLRV